MSFTLGAKCISLWTIMLAAGACTIATASAAQNSDTSLIEKGRYLAVVGDCVACHTQPDGKPMAGGLSVATPIGPIISTNITPSKTGGIGSYTLAGC